jgi:hypothetical protein
MTLIEVIKEWEKIHILYTRQVAFHCTNVRDESRQMH